MENDSTAGAWRTPCQTWTNEHCFALLEVPNAAAALAAGGTPEAVAACVDLVGWNEPLVLVGDTKCPEGQKMVYTKEELRVFVAGVKDGMFDDMAGTAESMTV